MSETKRLDASMTGNRPSSVVGGVYTHNNNPYPVEVTVRRVAEKVVFEANLCEGTGDDNWWIPQYHEQEAMRGRGYYEGQRVRVTIEPLE